MSTQHSDPLAHPEVRQASAGGYIAGFATSVALMLAALILTLRHTMPYLQFIEIISGLVLLALISQAALFFGLNLSRAQIWKSVSLVLTVPLFILSIGLTVWMFQTLYARTMLPMPGMTMQSTLLQ